LQVVARDQVRLRVYEHGTGETWPAELALAAVVAGIRWGLLDARVDVQTLGGRLTIECWICRCAGRAGADDGPATTVSARIEIPDGL
jgi:diaminopimelate epimerase